MIDYKDIMDSLDSLSSEYVLVEGTFDLVDNKPKKSTTKIKFSLFFTN